ncbi:hypothetical protein [Hungatella effluvii]|uniref:hypothetical protein n=1 Tax=Hungatella effluvii TaxID=1096246 RepID=UPI002A7F0056|nr:hypothetical protein [Hungatella effluvii]
MKVIGNTVFFNIVNAVVSITGYNEDGPANKNEKIKVSGHIISRIRRGFRFSMGCLTRKRCLNLAKVGYQFPDEIYNSYMFTLAKVGLKEDYVGVY